MNTHAPFAAGRARDDVAPLVNLTGAPIWFGYERVTLNARPEVLSMQHVDSAQAAPPPETFVGEKRVPVVDEGATAGFERGPGLLFIQTHLDADIVVTPDVGYCFWFNAPWFRGRVFSHDVRSVDKCLRMHRKPAAVYDS